MPITVCSALAESLLFNRRHSPKAISGLDYAGIRFRDTGKTQFNSVLSAHAHNMGVYIRLESGNDEPELPD